MRENPSYQFSEQDLKLLEEHGITTAEAQRQFALLLQPTRFIALERACTIGDGILTLAQSEHSELLSLHDRAANEGRLSKFVPASGAASRMFRELLCFFDREAPHFELLSALDKNIEESVLFEVLSNPSQFAFYDLLAESVTLTGKSINDLLVKDHYRAMLYLLLKADGLNYSQLPKALLAFHKYSPHEIRTALEEHLIEAALTIKNDQGLCRIHLTVSPEHLENFRALLSQRLPYWEQQLHVTFEISFSVQKASTETLSVGLDQTPFHDENGTLLLRPGGHGALIENLNDLAADIVFIKNIDNVQRDPIKQRMMNYKRLLAGKLLQMEELIFSHLNTLEQGAVSQDELTKISSFATQELKQAPPSDVKGNSEALRDWLQQVLDRPIRVCGVVRNTGEPGGGPFWVRDESGQLSLQIVESAQVDHSSPEQHAIFNSSTHFNPVDLVCSVRNYRRKPFDLHRFIDEQAIIKTRKSHHGRDLIACERPGLWNGAMAGWITLFIEVPGESFTPVKSVTDLRRLEHRNP